MVSAHRRTGDGSRGSAKGGKTQAGGETCSVSSSSKRQQGAQDGARETGEVKAKDGALALGVITPIGEALFEWYAFLSGCGNAALLAAMHLSQGQLSQDLNQPAVALIILFLLRRPLETHIRIALQKSRESWGAKSAVAAYILLLAVYTWKAAVSMPIFQFIYLMHTYWLWVLTQWLGSFSKPKAGWSDGSDAGRGGARGSATLKGQGRRSSKGGAGAQPLGGKGSFSGGQGSAVAGQALTLQALNSKLSAGDEVEKVRGQSIEATITSELWRILRIGAGEIVCGIYITCVLPATAVRKEHIFLNPRLSGWLIFYVATQISLLLGLKSVAAHWPRLCHWADILGSWQRVCAERSLPVFQQQSESIAAWAPGNCYSRGFLVRRSGEVYIATGKLNAADPESWVSHCLQFVAGPSFPLVNSTVALQLGVLLTEVISISHTAYWMTLMANFLLSYLNVYIGLCFRRSMLHVDGAGKPMQGI